MRFPNYSVAIVAYAEVGLKSSPVRARLENMLTRHLKAALKRRGAAFESIVRERGRIYILGGDSDLAAKLASRVFGIEYTAPALKSSSDIEAITGAALELAQAVLAEGDTFAVDARRVGEHPYTSKDLEVRVGAAILDHLGQERRLKVNLTNPAKTLYVEAREKAAYIYSQVYEGLGGLPYGSQGRVVALLTGDTSSALAAWLMMKRGAEVVPLYFDAPSLFGSQCLEEALLLAEVLREYVPDGRLRLTVVPFEEVAEAIRQVAAEGPLSTILLERAMYTAASHVSNLVRAEGLVTGCQPHPIEGYPPALLLGLRESANVPVYCPLIALSEAEISKLVEKIQLPPTPYRSRSPDEMKRGETSEASMEEIRLLESRGEISSKVAKALEGRRVVEVG